MDLISQLTLMGGACELKSLVHLRGDDEVAAALADGTLIGTRRGRCALATSPQSIRLASAFGGVLSHRSAAQHWGWARKLGSARPEITVPRTRHLSAGVRRLILPHWSDLEDGDVDGLATTRQRTLIDCMRNLPTDESLPVVDSALRADDVTHAELVTLAEATRGRGRTRIQGVAASATGKSANVFESVLRAQCDLVPGLNVEAQLPVRLPGTPLILHPDLADPLLKIALEAEGFEWHGETAALTRDCRRYNRFTASGWIIIRFSWYLVMFEPEYVQRVLLEAVALARRTCECRPRGA